MHRSILALSCALAVVSCGTREETAPEPAPEPAAPAPEPPPAPAPPPEPEPVADCPTDTWSVAANAPNRAAGSGVEAAGFVRTMGPGWQRLRACRNIDGFDHLLSCAPVQGGAECSLGLPTQRCSATLPGPTLAVVMGQWIDTHEVPSEGSWRCTRR